MPKKPTLAGSVKRAIKFFEYAKGSAMYQSGIVPLAKALERTDPRDAFIREIAAIPMDEEIIHGVSYGGNPEMMEKLYQIIREARRLV